MKGYLADAKHSMTVGEGSKEFLEANARREFQHLIRDCISQAKLFRVRKAECKSGHKRARRVINQ